MKIKQKEWQCVERYLSAKTSNHLRYLKETLKVKDVYVERKSEKDFDLVIHGYFNCAFSAWLPLGSINERLNWCSKEIARMTDYPEMVMEGDWSGVRDSEEEKIWEIFNKFKLGDM